MKHHFQQGSPTKDSCLSSIAFFAASHSQVSATHAWGAARTLWEQCNQTLWEVCCAQLVPQTGQREDLNVSTAKDKRRVPKNRARGGSARCQHAGGTHRPQHSQHSFSKKDHQLRKLVCEEGKHCRKGTQACCEMNEKGELLLWVNGDFVKCWQQFSVCCFRATWIGIEKVTFL